MFPYPPTQGASILMVRIHKSMHGTIPISYQYILFYIKSRQLISINFHGNWKAISELWMFFLSPTSRPPPPWDINFTVAENFCGIQRSRRTELEKRNPYIAVSAIFDPWRRHESQNCELEFWVRKRQMRKMNLPALNTSVTIPYKDGVS